MKRFPWLSVSAGKRVVLTIVETLVELRKLGMERREVVE